MTTLISFSGEDALLKRRSQMTVYKAQMQKALCRIPGPDGFDTLLDLADTIGSSNAVPREVRIAWEAVTQFERLNEDIEKWTPLLIGQYRPDLINSTPEIVDAIFELAIAIETKSLAAQEQAINVLKGILGDWDA